MNKKRREELFALFGANFDENYAFIQITIPEMSKEEKRILHIKKRKEVLKDMAVSALGCVAFSIWIYCVAYNVGKFFKMGMS